MAYPSSGIDHFVGNFKWSNANPDPQGYRPASMTPGGLGAHRPSFSSWRVATSAF